MALKTYSDVTKKFYDSVEDANAAEKEYNDVIAAKKAAEEAKALERKNDAKLVEEKRKIFVEARKASVEARKDYEEELSRFCEKHGSYHTTYTTDNVNDIFDEIFPWDSFINHSFR